VRGDYIKNVTRQHAPVFVLMAVTATALYAFMSYLTMFQMSDDIYRNTGFKDAIGDLQYSIENAFRHVFLLAIVLSLSSLFLKPQSILFKLNLLFLSVVTVVVVLKLLGIYPVINNKHVVWMVPIAVTLIAMYIHVMLSQRDIFGLFLMFFICFFVMKEADGLSRFYIPEINNNNALFEVLEKIEPEDIIVMSYAQPSLAIYQMKNPALSKHRYFGLMPKSELLSKKRSPDEAFDADQFTEWQFSELPQTRSFLVLISHERAIEEEPAEERIIALRNTLKENSCVYESIFKGTLTQLLKVSCAQPGEGGGEGVPGGG
jgi:hypothetical protein